MPEIEPAPPFTDRERLDYLLDQLSPSMFADHGIYALRRIATAMRAAGVGHQRDGAITAIDAAMLAAGLNPEGH